jgi:hypothetical protein
VTSDILFDEPRLRQFTSQLRSAEGRFRRVDPSSALDRLLVAWGDRAVAELREATPVENPDPVLQRQHAQPGTARASWRFDQEPGQHRVKVTNVARDERETAYLRFHVTGTPEADPGGIITPEVAPFLRFYDKSAEGAGSLVKRAWVHGIQPNPDLVAAIERLGPEAAQMLDETGIAIMRDLASFTP